VKWEYVAVTLVRADLPIKDVNEILNIWGRDGWELVTVAPDGPQGWSVGIFKRPLAENSN
jgi:hypothetical protein